MDVGFSLAQARTGGSSARVNRPLRLASGDPGDRLSRVLSPDFVENSVYIDEANQDLRMFGWVGLPHHNRRQMDQQYFYVNGRAIRDKLVRACDPSGVQRCDVPWSSRGVRSLSAAPV